MTSQFDNLMGIWGISKKEAWFKPLADFIANLAVNDANKRKKGYTLETWSASQRGQTVLNLYGADALNLYGADALKWEFLDDCHDVLDHTNWHLKVFNASTAFLISAIHDLLTGRDVYTQGLKGKTRPHYDEFMRLVKECGAEITKYDIKLIGVERRF